MGIYKRENGIYYLNKTINKRPIRLSLETKNYYEAKERYEMFCTKLFYNKMHNIKEIPLVMRESNVRRNFDVLSISAYQTSCLQAHHCEIDNRPNISKIYNDYLKIAKYNGITKETIQVKELVLTIFKKYNLEWSQINNDNILKIQIDLRQKYSKDYAYKIINNIRAFLNYAIKQECYDYNEYKKLEFLKAPKPQKRKVIISMDDFKDMLLYCDRIGNLDFKYYLLTLFFTGSRPREIVNLTYRDIDLKNNRISIWMNKTKKHKTLALNPMFAKELMNIIKFNGLTNGCLFIGSIKSDKGFYSRQFKIMKEELNLNPDYSLYLFRHTSGTLALEISKDIHKVKTLLGHDNVKITDQYYMLDNPEALREIQDELVGKIYGRNS